MLPMSVCRVLVSNGIVEWLKAYLKVWHFLVLYLICPCLLRRKRDDPELRERASNIRMLVDDGQVDFSLFYSGSIYAYCVSYTYLVVWL